MSTPGTLTKLPIIDIAPFLSAYSTPEDRAATAQALHTACVEYGFLYLDISKFVDQAEPEELARLARAFFDLPQKGKDKISLRLQDNARGEEHPCSFEFMFQTPMQVMPGLMRMLRTDMRITTRLLTSTGLWKTPTRPNLSGERTSGQLGSRVSRKSTKSG